MSSKILYSKNSLEKYMYVSEDDFYYKVRKITFDFDVDGNMYERIEPNKMIQCMIKEELTDIPHEATLRTVSGKMEKNLQYLLSEIENAKNELNKLEKQKQFINKGYTFNEEERFFTSDNYEIYSDNDERIVQINNEDFYVRMTVTDILKPIYKIGDEKSEFILNEIEYSLENTSKEDYEAATTYGFEDLTLQQLKNIREIFTTYMNKSDQNEKRFNYFIKELEKYFINMKKDLESLNEQ